MPTRPPDEPNKPKLNIHVQSVQGQGGTGLQFTAKVTGGDGSTLTASKQFGRTAGASKRGLLYEGDYKEGPYTITITAEEHPASDDQFTEGSITLNPSGSTLQASGNTQIKNAPGDQDERNPANYTITCVADITPAVEILSDVDVLNSKINFNVMPAIASGTLKVFFHGRGPTNAVVIDGMSISGGAQDVQFKWNTGFPQAAGRKFSAESVHIEFKVGDKKPVEDVRDVRFTGYGVFPLTRYYTPRDSSFGPPNSDALLDGQPVRVNSDWAEKSIDPEGIGEFQGMLVTVSATTISGHKGYRLSTRQGGGPVEEGNYRSVLERFVSIARHKVRTGPRSFRVDRRFPPGTMLFLVGSNPKVHRVDDSGNWGGSDNQFDVFMGRGGPSILSGGEPPASAYVVRLSDE